MRYCGLGALQDVDPVDRLNEALQFGLFSLFLDHSADPNANIFWKSSRRLSAFAGFLLAAYYSATTLDMDAYLRTLSAFRHAGADLNDTIKVGPLLGRLRSSMLFVAHSELLEDIDSSSTILEEFERQMWKASELGKNPAHRRMGLIRRALDAWGPQPAPDMSSAPKQNALVTTVATYDLT